VLTLQPRYDCYKCHHRRHCRDTYRGQTWRRGWKEKNPFAGHLVFNRWVFDRYGSMWLCLGYMLTRTRARPSFPGLHSLTLEVGPSLLSQVRLPTPSGYWCWDEPYRELHLGSIPRLSTSTLRSVPRLEIVGHSLRCPSLQVCMSHLTSASAGEQVHDRLRAQLSVPWPTHLRYA